MARRASAGGWWLVAVEYVSQIIYFPVPGLGKSSTADWDVDGAHMAERCMLVVIIALGESFRHRHRARQRAHGAF